MTGRGMLSSGAVRWQRLLSSIGKEEKKKQKRQRQVVLHRMLRQGCYGRGKH